MKFLQDISPMLSFFDFLALLQIVSFTLFIQNHLSLEMSVVPSKGICLKSVSICNNLVIIIYFRSIYDHSKSLSFLYPILRQL